MNHLIWPVMAVSLKVALCATALVMISSIFLGFIFAESRSRLVKSLETLVYVPMAMPPVALGYGLLLLFGQSSPLGKFLHDVLHIDIAFSFLGAVLASFMVSLGIGVRSIRVALEQIDEHQSQIAALLGANRVQIFWHIILPQCRPAILGGAVLVFIRALGEFGATMVLAGNSLGQTRTLALAIWAGMQTPGKERECLLLVLIAAVISLIALVFAEILLRMGKQ